MQSEKWSRKANTLDLGSFCSMYYADFLLIILCFSYLGSQHGRSKEKHVCFQYHYVYWIPVHCRWRNIRKIQGWVALVFSAYDVGKIWFSQIFSISFVGTSKNFLAPPIELFFCISFFAGLPGVLWVLPDSYIDVKNKDYGG